MRITRKQLLDLWKIRSSLLLIRHPDWILKNAWFPLLFFIVPWAQMNFDKEYAMEYLFKYMFLLFISASIYIGLYLVDRWLIPKKFSRQISLLLYIIFDLVMLIWLTFALFELGMLGLKSFGNFTSEALINAKGNLVVCFLLVSIITFLLSPRLLLWKIVWLSKEKKDNKNAVFFLTIISAAPGVGIMVASFLRLVDNSNLGGLLASTYLIFTSALLTVFNIVHLYEFLLFLTNKWPSIIKSKSSYIVFDKI